MYIKINEQELNIMSNKQKKSVNKKQKEQSEQKDKIWGRPWINGVFFPLVCSAITGLVSVIITVIILNTKMEFVFDDINSVNSNMENINGSITSLIEKTTENTTKVGGLEGRIDELGKRIDTTENDIKKLYKNVDNDSASTVVCEPTQNTKLLLARVDIMSGSLASPGWKSSDIVAENTFTGKKYTAGKLAGKKVLMPYTDDGYEIFFYGSFNKNYHWHGDCIINSYKQDKLEYVMEARYKDGEVVSYKQAFCYKNSKDNNVWAVSERKHNSGTDENTGNTWTYHKKGNIKKKFSMKNVSVSDMLDVSQFKKKLNTSLEGFYHGITSEGSFNDSTGKAYLVKYFKDGTLAVLYCGKFKDGQFDDDTGNAWYVTRGEKDSCYTYFKGKFDRGHRVETSSSKPANVTNKYVQDIITNQKFKCKIKLRK